MNEKPFNTLRVKLCKLSQLITTLSEVEEEVVVTFRKMTDLPFDDVLDSLQEAIPHLTRSSLYKRLKRHGCSRLPKPTDSPADPKKKAIKEYSVGYFHIDIAEVRTTAGKRYQLPHTKHRLPQGNPTIYPKAGILI